MKLLRLQVSLCLLLLALMPLRTLSAQESASYDLLLKGGTIIDGTGKAGFTGDLAIKDDRIVKIAPEIKASADQVISCKGLVIAPGFIDLHNHSDRQIVSPLTRANMNFITQG